MNAHAHKMDANHELKPFVPHNRKTSRIFRFRVHNKHDLQTLKVFAAAWLSRMLATALNAFKGHWWLQLNGGTHTKYFCDWYYEYLNKTTKTATW